MAKRPKGSGLWLVKDEPFPLEATPPAIGPLQAAQECLAVCLEQVRESYAAIPKELQPALQEAFNALMQTLQAVENATVCAAFRTGQLDFREAPKS